MALWGDERSCNDKIERRSSNVAEKEQYRNEQPENIGHVKRDESSSAPPPGGGRPLGRLFAALSREALELVRNQVDLAKAEVSEKASNAGKDLTSVAAGGALLLAGLLCFLTAAVTALAQILPLWLSALIVGFVVSVIGGIVFFLGMRKLKKEDVVPRRTIETVREEKKWLKNNMM